MSKNICPLCSTENEAEYKFCKNCGNPFISQEGKAAQNTEANNNQEKSTVTENMNNPQFSDFRYDGVSAEEMAAFIGKKANDILPKFTKMELTRSTLKSRVIQPSPNSNRKFQHQPDHQKNRPAN